MSAAEEDVKNEVNELEAKLSQVFKYGIDNGKTEDDIKMAMIKEGATFKNVTRLFNKFAVDFGLVMKKEDKDAAVQAACEGNDLSTEDGLNDVIDDLMGTITGSNEAAVLRLIRAWAKKQDPEIEVFKKAKGGGGGRSSGFRAKFYEMLKANPKMTADEVDAIISEKPEGDDPKAPNKSGATGNDRAHLTHYQGIRQLVNDIVTA